VRATLLFCLLVSITSKSNNSDQLNGAMCFPYHIYARIRVSDWKNRNMSQCGYDAERCAELVVSASSVPSTIDISVLNGWDRHIAGHKIRVGVLVWLRCAALAPQHIWPCSAPSPLRWLSSRDRWNSLDDFAVFPIAIEFPIIPGGYSGSFW
jgi:hypothetical protein